jgi:hypothetical protein
MFESLNQEEAVVAKYKDATRCASGCLGENLLANGQTIQAAKKLVEAIKSEEQEAELGLGLEPASGLGELHRNRPESQWKDRSSQINHARCLLALAILQAETGHFDEGLVLCDEALGELKALQDQVPTDLTLKRLALDMHESRLKIQVLRGKTHRGEAIAQQEKIVKERQAVLMHFRQTPVLRREAIASGAILASLLLEADKDISQSIKIIGELLPQQERLVQEGQEPWSQKETWVECNAVFGLLGELTSRNLGLGDNKFLSPGSRSLRFGSGSGPALFGTTMYRATERARFIQQWAEVGTSQCRPILSAAADNRLLARLLALKARVVASQGQAAGAEGLLDRSIGITAALAYGPRCYPVFLDPWANALSSAAQVVLSRDAEPCYLEDLAAYLALSSKLTGSDKAAERAVAVLDQYVTAGFDNAYKLRNDPRFAPLRGRQDFDGLVKDVESGIRQGRNPTVER